MVDLPHFKTTRMLIMNINHLLHVHPYITVGSILETILYSMQVQNTPLLVRILLIWTIFFVRQFALYADLSILISFGVPILVIQFLLCYLFSILPNVAFNIFTAIIDSIACSCMQVICLL